MPFYEYECQSCKYYTEVMQKISDPPLRKCPSCGKTTLKKLVSAPVFRLKGGGWYETDFKSEQESKRNLAGAEREDSGGTEAKAEDAKPAEGKAGDAKPVESKAQEKGEKSKERGPAAGGSASAAKRSSSRAKPVSRASSARTKPKTKSRTAAKSRARKARR
jgi:putative FmdB family regulatory protein